MNTRVLSAAFAAALSGAACGQSGWIIDVDYGPGQTSVHPGNPSCVVRISAHFPPFDWAITWISVDVVADEPGWAPPHPSNNLAPMNMASEPGTLNGGTVHGVRGGQFAGFHHVPDPRNPMPTWQSSWSAPAFTPGSVALATRTTAFEVSPHRQSLSELDQPPRRPR